MKSFLLIILFASSSFLFGSTDNRGTPSRPMGTRPYVRSDVMFFERSDRIFVERQCNINGKKYITDIITKIKGAGQMHAGALCGQLSDNANLISEGNKEIEITVHNSDGTTPKVRLCISTCGILNKKGEMDKKAMLKRNEKVVEDFFCSSYPCTVESIEPLRILSFSCYGKEIQSDDCTYRGLDRVELIK